MNNTNFIILLLFIFLVIAIHNMYRINKARIEWRNRLGYLITCLLREKLPIKEELKDLENLNKPKENSLEKSLSLSLSPEKEGLHLNIKSNITPEDVDIITNLFVQDKLMALAEGTQQGENKSKDINTYIKILSLIVSEYRTKLSKALVIIENEQS